MDFTEPRHRARRTVLASALVAMVAACGPGPHAPAIEQQLFGTWDWVRTENTLAGEVQTPGTVSFNRRLVITTTVLEVLRDGDVEESARYRFIPGQDLDDQFVPPRLVYEKVILGVKEHSVGFDGANLVLFSPFNPQMHVWAPAATD